MTGSTTRTASFTITDARYVGSKVGADLRRLNTLYGKPALDDIENYVEEIAQLLKDGYLATVDFGFRDKDSNEWKLRLRYRAVQGQLVDNLPGNYPTDLDVGAWSFYSYLSYKSSFSALSAEAQQQYKDGLPIHRTNADAPSAVSGSTTTGHGYGKNGTGFERDVYVAN